MIFLLSIMKNIQLELTLIDKLHHFGSMENFEYEIDHEYM